jgi:hypothetical protein
MPPLRDSGKPEVSGSCMLAWRGKASRFYGSPRPRAAPLAQSAERLHGKEKVYGSIP